MIAVRIQADAFDLNAECRKLRTGRSDIGALVSFTGIVRDCTMTLEHYPAMARKQMQRIADAAQARWALQGGVIIHRFGTLAPGEDIMMVAIASAHRAAAFDSAMFLMDWLKTRAPFWKSESREGGVQWVEARPEDDASAAKWEQ